MNADQQECNYFDDIIEEYLDDDELIQEEEESSMSTALELLNAHEMPSVKNFSHTPNKNDILKLIEEIEKNNQIIYESSKPKVMMKKRKPRVPKDQMPQQAITRRNEALLIEIPEPKLIIKPDMKTESAGIIVYHEKYTCQVCSEIFTSEFLLKRHSKCHPLENPIICCDKVFDVSNDYRNHKRVEHAQTVTCKCGKTLKNQKTYSIHLKSHLANGERKYKCDKKNCSKAFNMKIHLQNHLRTHTNQNPFVCPISPCTSAFKQKYQVTLHLRNKHNNSSSSSSSILSSETTSDSVE